MNERLANAFASGVILPPNHETPDLVHLAQAVANLTGVGRFEHVLAPTERVLDCIGNPQHLVLVLLDGLGINLLDRLPASSFLRKHLKMELRATTPSTTACALTSIATGTWPSEHGVTGWFTHLPTRGITVTTLHLVERFSGEPLEQHGIDIREVLPIPAFHPEMRAAPLTLLPTSIADTSFARYSRGGTRFAPYTDLTDASARIGQFILGASGQTFTHLYVPDVDSMAHHYGLSDDRLTTLLFELDEQLAQLCGALPKTARVVVTADHGLIEVAPEAHLPLTGEDALASLLDAPPSGDGRMPIFHVRAGWTREFKQRFEEQFGLGFELLASEEAEKLGLFGPGRMSPVARKRFGHFIGIALDAVILHYASRRPTQPQNFYLAQHAGLTPSELRIPLIVA